MSIVATAFSPSFGAVYAASAGTVGSATATLISITSTGATPDMVFAVSPVTALAAGVAMGQPYCVTKGTLVIPFINPTGADVDVGNVTVKVVGL